MPAISKTDHQLGLLGLQLLLTKPFFGRKPNVSHLEEFKMRCWVMVLN